MSDFEFIFALFGLLLGLSITEVLGGLARSIEGWVQPDPTTRVGWLTPLLALFVMLDLISFWRSAWVVRDLVTVSSNALLGVTVFASSYYLAARLVFARSLHAQPDHDEHFFRVRRVVIGILLALLFCQVGWYLSIPDMAAQILRPRSVAMTLLLASLMIAAMLVRGRRWATIIMAALVARYVLLYLI